MGASATERGFRVDRMRGAKAPSLAIDAKWRQFAIYPRRQHASAHPHSYERAGIPWKLCWAAMALPWPSSLC